MPNIDKIRVDGVDYNISGTGGGNEVFIGDEQDAPETTKLLIDEDELGFVNLDTMPIGSEVEYDGNEVPLGWEKVDNEPVYSDTETVCGTWIDGKPIYRKVFNITSPQQSNTDYVDVSSLNIDKVVNLTGFYKNSSGFFPIPLYDSASSYAVFFVSSSNYIRGRIWSADYAYIILEYTKTTDTAGGGN